MPNYTPLYNLIKPLPSEPYDINQHNQNADVIEAELQKRLLATAYTANDVLAKIKTVDSGAKSAYNALRLEGKNSSAFATAAQGANADDLISGAKSAYNALRLEGKSSSAFATAAQGANADDLISGAKSAYNAQRLGGKSSSAFATAAQGANADDLISGSKSAYNALRLEGKNSSAFATAAQGTNADDLISGAKSAYNAQCLGGVDALSYAEKVYMREYLGTRGGDSVIFNETAHPTFGGGSYWELEDVDYTSGGTINVINEAVGEVEAQFYFHLTYYGTPGVRIGLIDQDIKVGDKIYVALEAKVVDGTAMNSKLLFGANDTELIEDMQLTDTYKKFDQIFTVTSAQLNYSSGLISFRIRVHPVSGSGYGYIGLMIKSMMVVNLTRSFSNTFAPTIAQVRAKLLAFDNSFFWASAPIYSLVKGLKDRVSTLEANASLLWYWTGTDPQTYLDVIADNLPSLPSSKTSTVTINRANIYGAVILKRNNTNCKAIIMPHFGTGIIVAVMANGTWTERTI